MIVSCAKSMRLVSALCSDLISFIQVGDEGGKAKTAPMKLKVQFMLQVPQDDIRSSVLMFRIKKRWDI